jgi:methylglutaconyl-CoA hydratase
MADLLVSTGSITTVTLNRPDVRNAFDEALIAALTDFARAVPADGSVRAVVLQGAGPVFSAGADLNWMSRIARYTREENMADAGRAARMFHLLDSLPVPLIGRVHGAALGGGAGLTAVCDVVVAARDTVFGFTETTLGIVPAMISPYVIRKIGLSAARRWCLSGARFSAGEAQRLGLVHELVPASRLDAAVQQIVQEVLKAAPSAVAATKRLLADVADRRPGDVLALTVDALARQRVSPEGREGIQAFLDRRAASWAPAPPRPARKATKKPAARRRQR